jgi:hypothetical protein
MSNLFRAAAIGVAVSVAGCAIHPLPEDVTGISTYKIVQKIRCEARNALLTDLSSWLVRVPDDEANQLGADLQDGTLPFSKFYASPRIAKLKGFIKNNIRRFQNSAIAYDFTFTITEMNNLDPTVDLIRPLRNQTFSANINGNFDRTRKNLRDFMITDTFLRLSQIKEDYCLDIAEGKNYLYPITGTIGLEEMIRTFVGLAASTDLTAESPSDSPTDVVSEATSGKGPSTLADTITFTTTLALSATPKIVLSPIGTALQIADASAVGMASRSDVHQVIIALAVGSAQPAAPQGVSSAAAISTSTHLFVNFPSNGTSAEAVAAHTVEQNIIRFQLNNPAIAIPVQ